MSVEITGAEKRRLLKNWYAASDRVAALRRQIVDAAKAADQSRFEFFCVHGFAPPVRFPEYPEFPPECEGMTCCAKAKSTGEPCKSTQIFRNGRCKFHGGLSTGPKSAAGKITALKNLELGREPHGLPDKS